MSNKKDTFSSTLLVVFAVCLVCSVIVAGAAVGLRPMQIANKALDKQKNILAVAGVESDKSATEILFLPPKSSRDSSMASHKSMLDPL